MRSHLFALATVTTFLASPALADQLDGDWCNPKDGTHLEIQGSSIVTPAGTATTGDYGRHTFKYTVPSADPGAGGDIFIQQLNDDVMILKRPEGGEEEWRRCKLQTS